jgi:hypothetical protein
MVFEELKMGAKRVEETFPPLPYRHAVNFPACTRVEKSLMSLRSFSLSFID